MKYTILANRSHGETSFEKLSQEAYVALKYLDTCFQQMSVRLQLYPDIAFFNF
jgi:hypothetical protein